MILNEDAFNKTYHEGTFCKSHVQCLNCAFFTKEITGGCVNLLVKVMVQAISTWIPEYTYRYDQLEMKRTLVLAILAGKQNES